MVLTNIDPDRICCREKWTEDIDKLDYAFQPIVNIHTGITLGFEALLRGCSDAGFSSINELFDLAYNETTLYSLDLHLRELAISKLYSRKEFSELKLFYNLDNRTLEMPDYNEGNTSKFLQKMGLYPGNICFEISEKHEFNCYNDIHSILKNYKNQNFRLAIDDFGSGYAGLTLLYHSESDYIKIDRFFIEKINSDSRKKFFVANVVNLAHMMGLSVIAEGIETVGEFYVCREIGCDYAQGYLIQRPELDTAKLQLTYPEVERFIVKQQRKEDGDTDMIRKEIDKLQPVLIDCSTEDILEVFRNEQTYCCLPVINNFNEPIGLLREKDLKKYVYSPYGISILQHKSNSEGIESLIFRAPVMEISTPIEKILELYSLNQQLESVIITENGRYVGILESSAILRILSEKKISIAQDQNPLTRLPGNSSINSYIAGLVKKSGHDRIVAYFDFDNFKPFNDAYGFRQGDRIIRLFADILREHSEVGKEFIGHIGGDDFFAGYSMATHHQHRIVNEIRNIIKRFESDCQSFYKEEDRLNGYITAKNRSGRMTKMPLLSVSAAVICINGVPENYTSENFSERIAALKVLAKKSKDHIAIDYLTEG